MKAARRVETLRDPTSGFVTMECPRSVPGLVSSVITAIRTAVVSGLAAAGVLRAAFSSLGAILSSCTNPGLCLRW